MIARLVLVAVVVVVATVVGRWWLSRQGRVRATGAEQATVAGAQASGVGTDDLAGGVRSAVLVSTPTCRWCPQVRTALDRVAAVADDFSWTEVDAGRDLAFVRAHDVRRAPTVLFRDAADRVVARASGPMTAAQVAEAVDVDLGLPVG